MHPERSNCDACATRAKDDESLRRRVRERLAKIEDGDYSVIEMAADLERLARVEMSGACIRRGGCLAGLVDEPFVDHARTAASAACLRPPEGWLCTRMAGHDGPCAAVPDGAHE